jgi:hypothetical protein
VPQLDWNLATVSRGNRYLGHPPGGSSLNDKKRLELLDSVGIRFGVSGDGKLTLLEGEVKFGDEDGERILEFGNWE